MKNLKAILIVSCKSGNNTDLSTEELLSHQETIMDNEYVQKYKISQTIWVRKQDTHIFLSQKGVVKSLKVQDGMNVIYINEEHELY